MAKDTVVILERPWLSHPIYSMVYRDGKMHPWGEWQKYIELQQAVAILSVPTSEELWFETYVAGASNREELYGHVDHSKMQDVYNLFNSCLPQTGEISRFRPPELSSVDPKRFLRYDMFVNNTPAALDSWIICNVLPTLERKDGE
jgi:hypothetical protein